MKNYAALDVGIYLGADPVPMIQGERSGYIGVQSRFKTEKGEVKLIPLKFKLQREQNALFGIFVESFNEEIVTCLRCKVMRVRENSKKKEEKKGEKKEQKKIRKTSFKPFIPPHNYRLNHTTDLTPRRIFHYDTPAIWHSDVMFNFTLLALEQLHNIATPLPLAI